MPNHRTPYNVLDLTGRLKHDAKRYEDRTPPPEQDELLSIEAPELRYITFAEAWAIVVGMCPDGVLRLRDRIIVQETARLYMEINNTQVMAEIQGHPFALIPPAKSKLLQSYLAKLGASPTDANHVSVPKKPDKKNDFAD